MRSTAVLVRFHWPGSPRSSAHGLLHTGPTPPSPGPRTGNPRVKPAARVLIRWLGDYFDKWRPLFANDCFPFACKTENVRGSTTNCHYPYVHHPTTTGPGHHSHAHGTCGKPTRGSQQHWFERGGRCIARFRIARHRAYSPPHHPERPGNPTLREWHAGRLLAEYGCRDVLRPHIRGESVRFVAQGSFRDSAHRQAAEWRYWFGGSLRHSYLLGPISLHPWLKVFQQHQYRVKWLGKTGR